MACSSDLRCNEIPDTIGANPDVGGSGIIISFLVTAWWTLVVVLVTFNFSDSFPSDKKNDLDHDMVYCARKLEKYAGHPLRFLKGEISRVTVQKITLTLSDQQLITGTSIFIAIYAHMCDITQYHFKVAYYLGAASFLTHQSTVMVVSDLLKDFPLRRAWRMLWVMTIFAFVFLNNFVVYSPHFHDDSGLSVQCAFPPNPDVAKYPANKVLLILTSIFWAWGLLAVVRDLCPELLSYLRKLFRPLVPTLEKTFKIITGQDIYLWAQEREKATEPQSTSKYMWRLLQTILFPPIVFSFSFTQLASSTVIDLFRIITSLVATTLATARSKTPVPTVDGDNVWNFGQIMSILLLALPVFQALELLDEGWQTRPMKGQEIDPDANNSSAEVNQPTVLDGDFQFSPVIDAGIFRENPTSSANSNVDLKERLYSSLAFRVWMRFLVLGMTAVTCLVCTGLFRQEIVL